MLPLARCGVSDEELFTSGLNRVWVLSQAFYNFFSIICALTFFLMSYCSKVAEKASWSPCGLLKFPLEWKQNSVWAHKSSSWLLGCSIVGLPQFPVCWIPRMRLSGHQESTSQSSNDPETCPLPQGQEQCLQPTDKNPISTVGKVDEIDDMFSQKKTILKGVIGLCRH